MQLLEFLDKSPTPYHVVSNLKTIACDNGFTSSSDTKKFYKIFGDTASVFASLPEDLSEVDGFHIIGTHTDSPNLRLRPDALCNKNGYSVIRTEIYGGNLNYTWFDRDLSIAGLVVLNDKNSFKKKLVNFKELKCKIPSLAIHLNRDVNKTGFTINPHVHLNAILSSELNYKNINELISKELGVEAANILSYDLSLYDRNQAEIIGHNDFVSSARLDNLAMTYSAINSLTKAMGNKTKVNIFVAFDHEEVGSQSHKGADSLIVKDFIGKIVEEHFNNRVTVNDLIEKSLLISADMAHAIHPNYPEKHDELTYPLINKGPVIKFNSNQRYTSNAESVAFIRKIAKDNGIPLQDFVNRQDLACGSTIGPMISSILGINSIDLGNPMLSMHSIRELAGMKDHDWIIDLFNLFYSF